MAFPQVIVDVPCASARHLWRYAEDAERCCAGWVPVWVPAMYLRELEEWSVSPILPYEEEKAWIRVLVHQSETERLKALRAREPHSLVSSTGIENPWLRTQV